MVADSRVRAVSTEHNVKLGLYALGEPDSIIHQGRAAMKVDMDELMIEEQLYVGSPSMQHGGIKDTLEELWLPRVTQGVLVALRESEVDELSGAEAANARITKMCGLSALE
ncbi:hypothetical protein HC256_004147 [Beauveria bassiana]|nr:hypothetical protein HC256_004147 [Beauveria bassiana]